MTRPLPHTLACITAEDTATIKRELGALGTSNPAMRVIKRLEETFRNFEPKAVEKARDQYQRDGEIEIDEGAVCSRGDDPGLYVQAWVWVYDEEETP